MTGKQTVRKVVVNKDITVNAKFAAKVPAKTVNGINRNIHAKTAGSSLTVVWGKVVDADGYEIYMQQCYKDFDSNSKVKVVKGAANTRTVVSKINNKSLAEYGIVKTQIRAYKYVNGKKKYVDISVMLHTVISSSEYTNVKSMSLAKKAYTLNVNQTAVLKPVLTKVNPKKKLLGKDHGPFVLYYSTNKNVAVVSDTGKITAKASGKCTVYVITVNGVTQPVQITVR